MNITALIDETTEYDKKEMLEAKKPKSWLKSVSAFTYFGNMNARQLKLELDLDWKSRSCLIPIF